MILQSYYLVRKGRSVCIVDKSKKLGGAWQVAKLQNGEKIEIACHLIEYFPGVYNFLEKITSIPFVQLNSQPVRILRSGKRLPYLSRIFLIFTGLRLCIGWILSLIRFTIGIDQDREQLQNFRTKFKSFYRHQIKTIFFNPIIKGPENGFVDFIECLINIAIKNGVKIFCSDIQNICYDNNDFWRVCGTNPKYLCAKNIHCTTSTNLRLKHSGLFEAYPTNPQKRLALLVQVPESDIFVKHSYVAFWKDPEITRISRIDTATRLSYVRYLIEARKFSSKPSNDWVKTIREHLEISEILISNGSFEIVEQISCYYDSNLDQLPIGCIEKNFKTYYSYGNLAAGISAWLDLTNYKICN